LGLETRARTDGTPLSTRRWTPVSGLAAAEARTVVQE
jgi:hypothetical protein